MHANAEQIQSASEAAAAEGTVGFFICITSGITIRINCTE